MPTIIASLIIVVTAAVITTSADESEEDRKVQFEKRAEIHKQVKAAVEQNDYNAWVTAVSESKMAEKHADKINEETFGKLVEAHELFQSGDKEAAKEIMKELGLKKKHRKGFMKHKRSEAFQNLTDEQREALKAARESGDREQVKELMSEFGLKPHKRMKDSNQ